MTNKQKMKEKMKSKKESVMIVDGSNLAYRAYYSYPNINTRSHGHLGLVYGFLRILNSYIVRFKPDVLVVIFDSKQSKKSNFRNALLEEYKIHRADKTNLNFDSQSFNKQQLIVRRVLLSLGITIIWDKVGLGHETDDYIAYIARSTTKKEFMIISSDKDFYQLVGKSIKIFNPSKDAIVAPYNGVKIFGYKPSIHKEFLMLVGDKSDGVPGYKGIGKVRAKLFFEQFGTIQGYLDSKEEFPNITKQGVEFLYKRNRALIDLDYALEHYPITEVPIYNKKFNYERAFKLLDKYSMTAFLTTEFKQTFKELKQWRER